MKRTLPSILSATIAALASLCPGCAGAPDDVGLTSAALTTWTVNTTEDGLDVSIGDGRCATASGTCSLRAALMEASTSTDDVEIQLDAGVYELTVPPDREGYGPDRGGDLDVYLQGSLVLRGAGMHRTRIVASGQDRVFHVLGCTTMLLGDLSIEGGAVPALDEVGPAAGHGGGLANESSCEVGLDHVRVAENFADVGGGLANGSEGRLWLRFSEVRHNHARQNGGGVASFGDLIVTTSTIADGTSDDGAAGLFAAGTTTLTRSTLSGNVADIFAPDPVGGMLITGSARLENVTVSGNRGTTGGILNRGTATLTHVTLAWNGVTLRNCDTCGARTTVSASILYDRQLATCVGTVTSRGYNIDFMDECRFRGRGDMPFTDANLGDLGADMGSVWVHPIAEDGPARDAGPRGRRIDQRGATRDARPDIGAYEVLAPRFCVDSLEDDEDRDPGDGRCMTAREECTLRAAIQETNALPGPDVVRICVEGTIFLRNTGISDDGAYTGDLDIRDDLTIDGLGRDVTVIDGLRSDRVFEVGSGGTQAGVVLTSLTIRGGYAQDVVGGGVRVNPRGSLRLLDVRVQDSAVTNVLQLGSQGGGIANLGTLDLRDVEVSGNAALTQFGVGGGIWSVGILRMRWTEVVDNTAARGGGVFTSGYAELARTDLLTNRAMFGGGGLVNELYATIDDGTIGFNSAKRFAGGVWVSSPATLVERRTTLISGVTFRDNEVSTWLSTGAAIHAGPGRITLTHSTVSGNRGAAAIYLSSGGRIINTTIAYNDAHLAGPDIELVNTILAGTNAAWLAPCADPVTSLGHNIEAGASCTLTHPTDLRALISMLSLDENGGPTATHEITWDSPAVDAADPAYCRPTDQRGAPRLGRCDIGAYEYGTVP